MPAPTIRTLKAPLLSVFNKHTDLDLISSLLDDEPAQAIANAPWPDYQTNAEAAFAIAHGDDCIFLKFYVKEESLVAIHTNPNDLVYKDSCVEFFIGFDNPSKHYYNFEFNCAGTCLFGYGAGKQRELLPAAAIHKIRYQSRIQTPRNHSGIQWSITLMIPTDVFIYDEIQSLAGLKTCVNFFKCGDDLPHPHYLTWSHIESTQPNFHLSNFFGELQFA